MFQELAPILSKRSFVLTVAALEHDLIRLTVTPRSVGNDDPKPLTTPFVVEGTARELDEEVAGALISYTAEHLTLARSLANVKATMEAELQVAKDEAAKKVAEERKAGDAKKSSIQASSTSAKELKKEEPRKAVPPPLPNLFGDPEPQLPAGAAASLGGARVPNPVLPASADTPAALTAGTSDDEDEESFLLGESNDAPEDDDLAA